MHSLPLFVRLQGRPVILLGQGDAASAKRQLLVRAGADIVGEEAQAALAIVAIEDEGAAKAAIARLKARGVLVNAVDRPADCDFTLPAIIDRDPVLISIGTGGASAGASGASSHASNLGRAKRLSGSRGPSLSSAASIALRRSRASGQRLRMVSLPLRNVSAS